MLQSILGLGYSQEGLLLEVGMAINGVHDHLHMTRSPLSLELHAVNCNRL